MSDTEPENSSSQTANDLLRAFNENRSPPTANDLFEGLKGRAPETDQELAEWLATCWANSSGEDVLATAPALTRRSCTGVLHREDAVSSR